MKVNRCCQIGLDECGCGNVENKSFGEQNEHLLLGEARPSLKGCSAKEEE
jgi:hypothetical protein